MKSINNKHKLLTLCVLFTTLIVAVLILAMPDYFGNGARNAVYSCLNNVIPSLFCYMVISKIIAASGAFYLLSKLVGGLFSRVFHLSPKILGVMLISFISGYPTGAMLSCELYKNGELTKSEAEKAVAVCNNTGPALPVLLVGKLVFDSVRDGTVIYLIQVISAIFCALVFRGEKKNYEWDCNVRFDGSPMRALVNSVKESVRTLSLLCAYVILFSVLSNAILLLPLKDFSFLPLFEIVSGSSLLTGSYVKKFIILSAATSFGGLCVHMQSLALASECSLCVNEHFKHKVASALISAVLACVYLIFKIYI